VEILTKCELSELKNVKLSNLKQFEQAKVALAISFLGNPSLIVIQDQSFEMDLR
jgi:energy-coupling factor transporter ATP-binding protein EcfA2